MSSTPRKRKHPTRSNKQPPEHEQPGTSSIVAAGEETSPPASRRRNDHDDRPIFFFMSKRPYGEFCQWYPSVFTVSKAEIARLVGGHHQHPLAVAADETGTEKEKEKAKEQGKEEEAAAAAAAAAAATDPSGNHNTIDDNKKDDNKKDDNEEEKLTFTCAEQFMMYCKASRFRDAEVMRLVLESTNPRDQKALGRMTAGFTDASWDEVKSPVVEAGSLAKFAQNPALGRKLLGTGDRLLVEAAARDRVWGIGFSEREALSNRRRWGENRLGKALMVARDRLRRGDLGEGGEV